MAQEMVGYDGRRKILVLWPVAVAWPLFAVLPQMDLMTQSAFEVPTDCQVGQRDGSSPVRIADTLADLLREELMAKKQIHGPPPWSGYSFDGPVMNWDST
jgi:hypothetical protein